MQVGGRLGLGTVPLLFLASDLGMAALAGLARAETAAAARAGVGGQAGVECQKAD